MSRHYVWEEGSGRRHSCTTQCMACSVCTRMAVLSFMLCWKKEWKPLNFTVIDIEIAKQVQNGWYYVFWTQKLYHNYNIRQLSSSIGGHMSLHLHSCLLSTCLPLFNSHFHPKKIRDKTNFLLIWKWFTNCWDKEDIPPLITIKWIHRYNNNNRQTARLCAPVVRAVPSVKALRVVPVISFATTLYI